MITFHWGQFMNNSQQIPFISLFFLLSLLAFIFAYYNLLLCLNTRAQLNSFLSYREFHISPSIGNTSNRVVLKQIILLISYEL